jgi:membrane-associated PAP2 superfamily phosphatase
MTAGRAGWIVAAVLLAVAVLWDLSGLDMPVARLMGGPDGFALREAWWPRRVVHEGGRLLAWTVECALCLAVSWPVGPLRRLPFERRLQLALTGLLAAGAVSLLKAGNHTSCPWDLQAFGGIARLQSHWAGWLHGDGGGGRCFPAGHASAAFGLLGGWFALHRHLPRLATRWLLATLALGLVFGVAQQWRGAHFTSHTLWTAWVCWVVAWLVDMAVTRWCARRAADRGAA